MVGNSVDSVTVTPTVNHGGATVTVTVDTGATVNRSGSDYTFDLDVGSNVIIYRGEGPGRHDPGLYGDGGPGRSPRMRR